MQGPLGIAAWRRSVLPMLPGFEDASPASSLAVPPAVTPSVELHMDRQIISPFVERSTRYAVV
jgi:hypothetical protein